MIIRIFVISLLFYSCSMKEDSDRNDNMRIDLSTKKVYNYSDKNFNLSINYQISNNHFVFIKNDNFFKADISTTIQIYDINNDSIIIQDSWKNEIIEPYYDYTRSSSKYFSFYKTVDLLSGEYFLRVNVQDLDNSNVFKSQEKIYLSALDGFGEFIIYTLDKDGNGNILLKEVNKQLELDNNHIRLSFQYFQPDGNIKELLIELDDSNSKYIEKYFNLSIDENGFYFTDFSIPDNFYNDIDLTLSISKYSITKKISIKNPDNKFWTNDVEEIISVMRYILDLSEIKALKSMETYEKLEFISNYWSDNDPNPDTEENELLIEFVDRVEFANLKFSDLNKGYRSDRGRIHIIYGVPEMIERYSNQSEGIYEVWQYPSGVNFMFLDRNGFGNFILIKQTL